jgi:hypothetical protein
MKDMYTKQRKQWIESVSPFHLHESRVPYMMAWTLGLIFGTKMPHERNKK